MANEFEQALPNKRFFSESQTMRHFLAIIKRQIESTSLPVDERISLLALLEEVHKFALAFCQVDVQVPVHGIAVRAVWHGQALIGVHNLETHYIVCVFFL